MKRADHVMQVDINDVEEASQTEDFIQLFIYCNSLVSLFLVWIKRIE